MPKFIIESVPATRNLKCWILGPSLREQMHGKDGTIYHISYQNPQYGIWTRNPVKGHLVLRVWVVAGCGQGSQMKPGFKVRRTPDPGAPNSSSSYELYIYIYMHMYVYVYAHICIYKEVYVCIYVYLTVSAIHTFSPKASILSTHMPSGNTLEKLTRALPWSTEARASSRALPSSRLLAWPRGRTSSGSFQGSGGPVLEEPPD